MISNLYFKYIKETNKIEIFYLLYWYNKQDNKNYIIEFAFGKIVVNNLLLDELYTEFNQEYQSFQDSGFIYEKDCEDYLCSSSTNGFINIWNLSYKFFFKSIIIIIL